METVITEGMNHGWVVSDQVADVLMTDHEGNVLYSNVRKHPARQQDLIAALQQFLKGNNHD